MKKTRILWVSRHELTEKNHEILKQAFGNYEIIQYAETVKNVEDLPLDEVDVVVAVLPPQLLMQLLRYKPVFRFLVERKVISENEVEFIPVGLERILKVEIVTEKVV